jgi:hypothetical protein
MSPGIAFSLHWWRGIGPDIQPDLFWWRFRLGFVTVSVERVDLLAAYRKLRATIAQRVAHDLKKDKEGR